MESTLTTAEGLNGTKFIQAMENRVIKPLILILGRTWVGTFLYFFLYDTTQPDLYISRRGYRTLLK